MDLSDLLSAANSGEEGQEPKKSSPLQSLKVDLDFYSESIKEISTEMVAEGYTLFPIFIATQHEVSLWDIMIDSDELITDWSGYASSLEAVLERGVISNYKNSSDAQTYRLTEDVMCLSVVVPEGAHLVFFPYK